MSDALTRPNSLLTPDALTEMLARPMNPMDRMRLLQMTANQPRAAGSAPGMQAPVPPSKPPVPESQGTDDAHPLLTGADMANKVGSGGTTKDPSDALKSMPWNRGFLDAVKQYMNVEQNVQPSEQDKGMALAQAGAAMAASNSPYFGQALGQGALTGLQALQASKSSRAEMAMKMAQLQNESDYRNQTLGIQQQNANTTQQRDQVQADWLKQRALVQDKQFDRQMGLTQAQIQHMQAQDDALAKKTAMTDLPEGTGDAFLTQLPQSEQTLVKKIVDGDVDPKTLSARDGYRNRLITAAAQYDDNYNQQDTAARFKAKLAWAPGGQVGTSNNALDTVVGHLGNLSKDIDKLNNYNGVLPNLVGANDVKNWWTTREGKTAVTNFNTDADAVASELAKAYKGAGSVAEGQIKEWRSNLSPNMSQKQQQESLNHVLGLLDSKADANLKQWNDTFGSRHQKDPSAIYGEKSRGILAGIAPDRYGSLVPSDTAPASAPPSDEDIAHTAQLHGMTVGQVRKQLGLPDAP